MCLKFRGRGEAIIDYSIVFGLLSVTVIQWRPVFRGYYLTFVILLLMSPLQYSFYSMLLTVFSCWPFWKTRYSIFWGYFWLLWLFDIHSYCVLFCYSVGGYLFSNGEEKIIEGEERKACWEASSWYSVFIIPSHCWWYIDIVLNILHFIIYSFILLILMLLPSILSIWLLMAWLSHSTIVSKVLTTLKCQYRRNTLSWPSIQRPCSFCQ